VNRNPAVITPTPIRCCHHHSNSALTTYLLSRRERAPLVAQQVGNIFAGAGGQGVQAHALVVAQAVPVAPASIQTRNRL